MVPYRSISALSHSLHVQSPSRQVVACYHSQCVPCCCADSAGPTLPHRSCLFYETCSQGTDKQGEEEKLDHTHNTSYRPSRNTSLCDKANVFWGLSMVAQTALNTQFFNPEEIWSRCSLSQLLKISHFVQQQHSLHGLLDSEKKAVDQGEDCDQLVQLSGDSCRYPVGIFQTKTINLDHTHWQHPTGEWPSSFSSFLCSNPHQNSTAWSLFLQI